MRTIEAIRRSAVAVHTDQTVAEAAAAMDASGVGALCVIDGDRLVGIVTDRDLTRRALARKLPADARVDSVMTTPVLSIDADADLRDAFPLLRANAVRRLPVVRDGERLVGMITADDLLVDLVADLGDLVRPVAAEVLFGHHDSAVPTVA